MVIGFTGYSPLERKRNEEVNKIDVCVYLAIIRKNGLKLVQIAFRLLLRLALIIYFTHLVANLNIAYFFSTVYYDTFLCQRVVNDYSLDINRGIFDDIQSFTYTFYTEKCKIEQVILGILRDQKMMDELHFASHLYFVDFIFHPLLPKHSFFFRKKLGHRSHHGSLSVKLGTKFQKLDC